MTTHHFKINASVREDLKPDGEKKQGNVWAYGLCNPGTSEYKSSVPGPQISKSENGPIVEGDQIVVDVCNDLEVPTTIHWHGMHQRNGNWKMDGVDAISQAPIPPGESFPYKFIAEPHGTHWYHSHSGVQYSDGLFGALIVQEKENPYAECYVGEHVVLINDWFHQPSDLILKDLQEGRYLDDEMDMMKCGDMPMPGMKEELDWGDVPFQSALINGRGRYLANSNAELSSFDVTKGKAYRFRIINGSSTYTFRFAIDDHKLKVIATDGQLTEPQEVDNLVVSPGERFDVIMTANQPVNNYWVRAFTQEEDMPHGVLAILKYKGANGDEPTTVAHKKGKTLDLSLLEPHPRAYVPPAETATVTKVLNLGGSMMKPFVWTIDGKQFFPPKQPIPQAPNPSDPPTTQIHVKKDDVVRLILNNKTMMNHPMHLHGHSFHVLGQSKMKAGVYADQPLNLKNPILKDTLEVQRCGWAVIQWTADNPGWWFFHCHIEWHLATGMALVIREGNPT